MHLSRTAQMIWFQTLSAGNGLALSTLKGVNQMTSYRKSIAAGRSRVSTLSSDHNQPGQVFTATLTEPLVANGFVVARHGQTVEGRV